MGPFICDTKEAGMEADSILKHMGFQPRFTWYYDPFNIITNLRVEFKITPYNHTPRSNIEKYLNQEN